MANLCDRCEQVFDAANTAFEVPSVVERYSPNFGSYHALQQNAEGRRCQLCCILFSLRRQDAVDQLIQNLPIHQDQLDFAFELDSGDSGLLSLNLFHPEQTKTRLFRSQVRIKKSAR